MEMLKGFQRIKYLSRISRKLTWSICIKDLRESFGNLNFDLKDPSAEIENHD
jgi:hypothetical protein